MKFYTFNDKMNDLRLTMKPDNVLSAKNRNELRQWLEHNHLTEKGMLGCGEAWQTDI